MKLSQLYHLAAATVNTSPDEVEEIMSLMKSLDTRNGWKDIFQNAAQFIMYDDNLCQNLQKCVNTMLIAFENYITIDPTNNYVILAFCGKDEERKPDADGNVWWYDGLETGS